MRELQWAQLVFSETVGRALSNPRVRGALGQLAVFIIVPVLYFSYMPWWVNVICVGVVVVMLCNALWGKWFDAWWSFVRLLVFVSSIVILQFYMPREIFLLSVLLFGIIFSYIGWEARDRRWRFSGGGLMVWAFLSAWLTLGDRLIDRFM